MYFACCVISIFLICLRRLAPYLVPYLPTTPTCTAQHTTRATQRHTRAAQHRVRSAVGFPPPIAQLTASPPLPLSRPHQPSPARPLLPDARRRRSGMRDGWRRGRGRGDREKRGGARSRMEALRMDDGRPRCRASAGAHTGRGAGWTLTNACGTDLLRATTLRAAAQHSNEDAWREGRESRRSISCHRCRVELGSGGGREDV